MDIRTIMEEGQLLPYRRCYRPMMVDGKLDWNAGVAYIQKPEYARDGAMFVEVEANFKAIFKDMDVDSLGLRS
jgi:hypothetical protein